MADTSTEIRRYRKYVHVSARYRADIFHISVLSLTIFPFKEKAGQL